jgi:hypothetical protein
MAYSILTPLPHARGGWLSSLPLKCTTRTCAKARKEGNKRYRQSVGAAGVETGHQWLKTQGERVYGIYQKNAKCGQEARQPYTKVSLHCCGAYHRRVDESDNFKWGRVIKPPQKKKKEKKKKGKGE